MSNKWKLLFNHGNVEAIFKIIVKNRSLLLLGRFRHLVFFLLLTLQIFTQ